MFIATWTDKIFHYGNNTSNIVEIQHVNTLVVLMCMLSVLYTNGREGAERTLGVPEERQAYMLRVQTLNFGLVTYLNVLNPLEPHPHQLYSPSNVPGIPNSLYECFLSLKNALWFFLCSFQEEEVVKQAWDELELQESTLWSSCKASRGKKLAPFHLNL
uniref:Uncharacterized protein n=1 Tax=Lactuca sativa TaxID=4236 RepID=A0A9R1WHV9_LACSA|nr:hypothetical protein LSAT_V11C200096250 [Lactuca sativa]